MDFDQIIWPFTIMTVILGAIAFIFSLFFDIKDLGERFINGNMDLAIFLSACAIAGAFFLTYYFMRKAEED